jgi:hypothetical protein
MVSFNLRLNHFLGFSRSFSLLLSWSLLQTAIVSSGFCPPLFFIEGTRVVFFGTSTHLGALTADSKIS